MSNLTLICYLQYMAQTHYENVTSEGEHFLLKLEIPVHAYLDLKYETSHETASMVYCTVRCNQKNNKFLTR